MRMLGVAAWLEDNYGDWKIGVEHAEFLRLVYIDGVLARVIAHVELPHRAHRCGVFIYIGVIYKKLQNATPAGKVNRRQSLLSTAPHTPQVEQHQLENHDQDSRNDSPNPLLSRNSVLLFFVLFAHAKAFTLFPFPVTFSHP